MFFAFFVLGYLVLSSPSVQNTLERYRISLTCAAIAGIVLFGVLLLFVPLNSLPSEFGNVLAAGSVILAMIGLGKHYVEKHNRFSEYLSVSSVYRLHLPSVMAVTHRLRCTYVGFQILWCRF